MTNAIDNITCVIKTFERPACCKRLIDSIRKYYPGIKIIVADDSREPMEWEGCETVKLPFDVGISAGRNAAVTRVQTKWFVLLDDDFVFTENTELYALMEQAGRLRLDILGARVEGSSDYNGVMWRDGKRLLAQRVGGDELEGLDIVNNFFIADTNAIRGVGGWPVEIKLCEHTPFFWRAKGRLRIGYTDKIRIAHSPEISDFYEKHRARGLEYFKKFMLDEGILAFVSMYGEEIIL